MLEKSVACLFLIFLFPQSLLCKNVKVTSGSKLQDVPPGRYDRTKEFVDRTLYVEYMSKDFRGHWLGIRSDFSAGHYETIIHPVPEQNTYVDQHIRIEAIDCGEDTICLRSRHSEYVENDNNYWFLVSSSSLTYISYKSSPAPQYNNDYKWKIYCTSMENTDACYICDITQTAVNSEWICLYANPSNLYVGGSSLSTQEHNWRIVTHSAADNGYSINHFDLCNDMQAAVYLNYSYCVGVEVPLFSGWTVSTSLGMEIKEAVENDIIKAGATHASDWTNEMYHYQTWLEEKCSGVELPVPPRTSITVQQMTVSYGPFLIKGQKLNVIETDLGSCETK